VSASRMAVSAMMLKLLPRLTLSSHLAVASMMDLPDDVHQFGGMPQSGSGMLL